MKLVNKSRRRSIQLSIAGFFLALAGNAHAKQSSVERGREYFSDTELIDQYGRRLRWFSDLLADRVVLINFVYATCPDACPMATQKLIGIKTSLGAQFGAQIRFLSISVDPKRDTPQKLAEFSRKQGAVHDQWRFLSGSIKNIETIIRKLGQHRQDLLDHSTIMIAGNATHAQWVKIRPDAPPEFIVETLKRLILPGKQ